MFIFYLSNFGIMKCTCNRFIHLPPFLVKVYFIVYLAWTMDIGLGITFKRTLMRSRWVKIPFLALLTRFSISALMLEERRRSAWDAKIDSFDIWPHCSGSVILKEWTRFCYSFGNSNKDKTKNITDNKSRKSVYKVSGSFYPSMRPMIRPRG